MKPILAIAASVLLALTTADAKDAKTLYAQKCAQCHGREGKAETALGRKLGAKDLTATQLSEEDIVAVINSGRRRTFGHVDAGDEAPRTPPKMTAFKGKMTDGEIQELARFVKNGLK